MNMPLEWRWQMRPKRVAIYTRVSTGDQHCEVQESEARDFVARREWEIYRVYRDQAVSGATISRPALNEMLADCRRRKFDVLLVVRLDRLGRSLRHLLTLLDDFRDLGIDFLSLHEALDTSTSSGKALFQMVAVFAEFERDLIRERVRAGLAHARQQGKRLGRPPLQTLSRDAIRKLRRERRERKVPYRVLAKKWGVSVFSAYHLCNSRG
jgi:DNA invertase Pin-like site-specific DNA recombinase